MQDVKRLILTTLTADTTMKALLGVTRDDPRIYPSFNPDPVVNPDSKPAFITYRLLTQGEAAGRIKQPTYRLSCWAISSLHLENLKDRVISLLDKKKFTTDASRVIWIKEVYETDTAPEATSSTNLPGSFLDFRVGFEDTGIN